MGNALSYPLNRVLEVMKPHKVDIEKMAHQVRLEEMFTSPAYIAEPKIDGCHYICIGGRFFSTKVSKTTGQPIEKTEAVPHLLEGILEADLSDTILDGEIFYPGWRSYDVTTITGCKGPEAVRRQEDSDWLYFMVFDILRDPNGKWLLDQPWSARREILERVGQKLNGANSRFNIIPVVRSRKKQFLDRELAEGREGIVLKHVAGLYHVGKRPMWNWTKLKVENTDDVVITGFDAPERLYTGKDVENWKYWEEGEPVTRHYHMGLIGSIRFGKYDSTGNLVDLGSCTGLDDETRRDFTENQDGYHGQVIEIKYMEKTTDGKYRHPNFIRVHSDKNPHECVIE